MEINDAGLDLIRKWEGFRALAYRDAAGHLTIGYGHTSQAGEPEVKQAMKITQEQAEEILKKDVSKFSEGVKSRLKRQLSDDQFSALVSFAYNIGLSNFAKSSVLQAVNAADDEAVLRRLGLWVKAGGRTLPGLVKRRAAEAVLYSQGKFLETSETEPPQRTPVSPQKGKPLTKSTTIWAALLATIIATANHYAMMLGYSVAGLIMTVIVIALAFWIISERRKKAQQEGI